MTNNFFQDIHIFIQKLHEEFTKDPKVFHYIQEQFKGIKMCNSIEEIFIYLNTLFYDICKNKSLSEKIRNDICCFLMNIFNETNLSFFNMNILNNFIDYFV